MRRTLLLLLAVGFAVLPVSAAFAQDASRDGETEDDALLLRQFRGLGFHPIGWTVPDHKLRLTSLIRMQPAGFRASEFDHWFAPTFGLGHGWEAT